MRRIAKTTAACLPLRKTAAGATAVRRGFPAWIDAEQGLSFSASAAPVATPRVRAGLVLRRVSPVNSNRPRPCSNVRGDR